MKYEIEFIIKRNESLAKNKKTPRLNSYCQNMSMETIFMNTENNKMNEPHKFVLNLSQRLDFRSLIKHIKHEALQNYLFITNGKI